MPDTATLIRPRKPPLSPEYVGLARALVRKFDQQEPQLKDGLNAIWLPLKLRCGSGKSQRPGDIAQAVRLLDTLPQYGLLHEECKVSRSGKRLDVWRVCIASGSFRKLAWQGDDYIDSLLLISTRILVEKKTARLETVIMAVLGRHAITRFMQRGLNNSEEALFADLAAMAAQYDVLLASTKPAPHRWQFETANGRYVGESVRVKDRMVLSCDSFHASDFN